MPRRAFEVFGGAEYPVPQFSAGAVAEVFGLDRVWKLRKLLERYELEASGKKASGKKAKGQGSRREFKTYDVYRLAIAIFLAKDGFTPKLISQIVQEIEDHDFIDFDERGEEVYTGIALTRTGSGPKLSFFKSGHPPDIKPGGKTYYVLDLSEVTAEIDQRISKLTKKHER